MALFRVDYTARGELADRVSKISQTRKVDPLTLS